MENNQLQQQQQQQQEDSIFVKEKNLFKDDIVEYQLQYCLVVRVAWDHDNLDVDEDDDYDNDNEDDDDQYENEDNQDDGEDTENDSGEMNDSDEENKIKIKNSNNNSRLNNKNKFYSTDEINKINLDKQNGKSVKEYIDDSGSSSNSDNEKHHKQQQQHHHNNYNDNDSEYDYYDFKNNESGVLLLVISSSTLIEVDYNKDDLLIFDRRFYLTDSVQKINNNNKINDGQTQSPFMMGTILKCQKKHFIVPFSIVNTGLIIQNDLIILDKVYSPAPLVVGDKVTDLNKIAAGSIINVTYDLECIDVNNNNKIVKIKKAEPLENVFFHKIYNNDDKFCPGKIIFSKSKKKLVITKVIPVEAEIEWQYFFKENCSIPSSTLPIDKLIQISNDYQSFNCFEPIVYKDELGNDQGGYMYLTKSKYTVAWQNGEVTLEESTDLMICDSLATDYFPGQVVCTSGLDVEKPYCNYQSKWGVIVSSNPTERVCTINWNNINHENKINNKQQQQQTGVAAEGTMEDNNYLNDSIKQDSFIENNVSVYDIEYLEEYNFDDSDYVCKLDDENILKEADVLGQVIGKEGLFLKVRWNNGFIELVYPFELTSVDGFDETDSEDDDDDDDDFYYDNDEMTDLQHPTVTNREQDDTSETEKEIKDVIKKIEDENKQEEIKTQQQQQQQAVTTTELKEEPTNNDENNDQYENGCIKFEILKEFEVHNFMDEKFVALPGKKFLTTVGKEFEILSSSMPPGIFVRANSSKLHLLSALIIGPQDTIYENSIFVFDIYLPPQYPAVPPKLFYHSVSFKLHPNLNVNGTVCLSLLGTWHGNKNEMWIPDVSNLLQVLISIQGLILGCKEPYFLEAGYDTQIGTLIGIRNSSIFNEDSYLLSLETILFYLKNQPNIFKQIILNHFKLNFNEILNRIDEFLNSNNNNNGSDSGTTTVGSNKKSLFCISLPPSQGFSIPLKKIKNKIEQSIQNK